MHETIGISQDDATPMLTEYLHNFRLQQPLPLPSNMDLYERRRLLMHSVCKSPQLKNLAG